MPSSNSLDGDLPSDYFEKHPYHDASFINTAPTATTWEQLQYARSLYIDKNRTFRSETAYGEHREKNKDQYRTTVLRGIFDRTKMTDLYFSEKNIQNIMNQIRYAVYLMSQGECIIDEQPRTDLVVIMRSIYLTYCDNLPYNIKGQIKQLNDLVVKRTVPDLLSNAYQYIAYLEDANESHRVLIHRPVNVNNTGIKTIEMGNGLGFSETPNHSSGS